MYEDIKILENINKNDTPIRQLEFIFQKIKNDFKTYDYLLKNVPYINELCRKIIGNITEITDEKLYSFSSDFNIYNLLYLYCELNNIEVIFQTKENFNDAIFRSDIVEHYTKVILKSTPNLLTREEEKELFIKYKNGDKSARKTIIEANLRLVVNIAKRYKNRYPQIEFMDIIEEGNIGLIKSIETFDVELGYRLSTYATYWIHQSITRYISNNYKLIRLPVYYQDKIKKFKKDIYILESKLNHKPSLQEMSEYTGFSIEEIKELLLNMEGVASLDENVGEDDSTLGDFIADDISKSTEELVLQQIERDTLLALISKLNDAQQTVLKLRFGLIDGRCRTLQEIGKNLHITRERVRQIEESAIRKLKKIILANENKKRYKKIK